MEDAIISGLLSLDVLRVGEGVGCLRARIQQQQLRSV